jgi:glyoxylase-like metal-dependent hydrolase (beta-lactamase superfamily II)
MKHESIQVTPHLFQLGVSSFPAYLSMGEIGMIIEGGTGPTTDIIVSQVESLGIDPTSIKYIVLTHTHADHVGGYPRLRKLWPHVKIVASPTAAKLLQGENFVKEFMRADKMIGDILIDKGEIQEMPQGIDEYIFEVDRIVEDGEKIDLGHGIVWEVFSTPGHSPCHISLFEEKEKHLVAGDMTGFFDPETEEDVFWPNYFQSLELYCNSIKRMAAVPAERVLLSHNGVVNMDAKTYMNKALRATEAYHQELVERLANGEDRKAISSEKRDFVISLGPLAYSSVIEFLCNLLTKNSQKENERGSLDFQID